MRILFLDDMAARHVAFEQAAIGHVVHHAFTAAEAIQMLEKNDYDLACLDHDLGPEHYVHYDEGDPTTGRAVAHWIAEHGKPRNVIIHSMNPVGAHVMLRIIEDNETVRVRRCSLPRTVNEFAATVHE